jgi:biopolymer transport protein ExbB/TolQ
VEPTVQPVVDFSIAHAFEVGGPVMYVIALVGLLTLLIIVERFVAFKNLIINKKDFSDNLYGMILRGDLRQAIAYCDSRPAPLSTTVKAGLVQALNKRPDEEVQVAMDAAVLRENPRFEGWISFLAVTGNVAVLAGLLGTIIGMIRSFASVANADQATKAQELSRGISEALNCTAFGLLVSILAIVAYGYFQMRVQKAENEVIESSMTVLNLVVANRDKMKD